MWVTELYGMEPKICSDQKNMDEVRAYKVALFDCWLLAYISKNERFHFEFEEIRKDIHRHIK